MKGCVILVSRDLNNLIHRLSEIKDLGWIENKRYGNQGGVGNTLEDLLEISENNLQLPDFGEWEIKSQRAETSSLLTLFHSEPKPRNARFVPKILLPKYGWPHQEAGTIYPENEMSFRQTISASSYSDRGFTVGVDRENEKIFITFDSGKIASHHDHWKNSVANRIGLSELNPIPYWDFHDIESKISAKLKNTLYVKATTKRENGIEYYHYEHFEVYTGLDIDNFVSLVEEGQVYIDFDARTGHNHGTKFRIRPAYKNRLYDEQLEI